VRLPLALVAAAAVLSACGTTVTTAAQNPVGPDGLGSPPPGGALGTTGGTTGALPGTTGVAVPGGATGTTTGTAGGTSSGLPGTSGTTSGGNPLVTGPGVTEKTISIGLQYSVNSKAAAGALGASGAGVGGGNDKRQWEIALADINARGGVLGRKLVPVWHENDSTDQRMLVQQESEACADWTQDHKVLAVIAPEADPSNTLISCLHRAGAAQLWEDLTRADAQTFAQFPYYLEGGTLRMDRVAAAWPGALQRLGYFTGWSTGTGAPGPQPVKVGIVSFDDPVTVRAVERQLKPALAAVGHPAVDWVQVGYPTSAADNGRAISQIQGATLRFASDRITHVLPFDSQGAGIGGFFAEGANSQRYYPRYGLNSGVGAQTLHDTGLWPDEQLRGAVGFGWVPLVDLPIGSNPPTGPYSNAARRACVKLMSSQGEDVSSAIVQRQVIAKCDELRFLKEALELGGAPNRDALVVGAQRLGTRFESGMTFRTRYDARHHDGASAARDFAWDGDCGCFRYTSGLRPVP
jgi:hypothetical protein